MPELKKITTFKDNRGSLGVLEDFSLFPLKRVYFITSPKGVRGGHRHIKTLQAMICLHGKCEVYCNNGVSESKYSLNSPEKLLMLFPEDWHQMQEFSSDCVLLVLASENFSHHDYIHTPYDSI